MPNGIIKLRVVIENPSDLRDIIEALKTIDEAVSDSPWMTDLAEAAAKIRRALAGMSAAGARK